ncbi:MAG TPA: GNAT family N-acetyltransferase [Candidatus Solibacter sp.]|jgi:L-amino acid N-acyltransferase YncA|nr:GNAT family N-acetyltransferase [Candidatus Solibacter sp.]
MASVRNIQLEIRDLSPEDWPRVKAIYEAGIATRNATFARQAPPWDEWDAAHEAAPRLVASRDGEVVGWAVLAGVSSGCAYGGVMEVSIYIDPSVAGQGIGSALMSALIDAAEAAGIWTLEAWIFPENEASMALHQRHGFRVVGRREKLGQMDDRWRDVMLLERRSAKL